jgi:hypothetical protein
VILLVQDGNQDIGHVGLGKILNKNSF